jgi:integrase
MGFRTQAQVARLRLPEGKTDAYAFDDECTGLSIRLQGDARRWVVWYQVNGDRRKITLGAVAGLLLKEARIKAGRIVADARDGKDALKDRAAAKARAADTFGDLMQIYLKERAEPKQRPRTLAETRRYLEQRWKPLHERPLSTVTSADIDERVHEILRDHGAPSAVKARTYLNMAFSWAIKQPRLRVTSNPVVGTTPPDFDVENGRALRPVELVAIWKACEGRGEFGTIVRLLMLTGARRSEVAALPWTELDLDQAIWRLPAERGQSEHEVPLPRQTMALIEGRQQVGTYVFGRHGRSPFSGFSRAKASLDRALGQAVEPWSLHDLRTSMVTHSADKELAPPHVIEAAINHLGGHRAGVAGLYNQAKYREPKRTALQAWADWLEALVEGREPGGNVVALRA